MKLTDRVAKLRENVEAGKLDTASLRSLWNEIYGQAGGEVLKVGDIVGHPVVFCDSCGQPCFAANTRSAYSGARWICEDPCAEKYAYCEPCRTFVLIDDIANPTHVHEGKDAHPGHLYFPVDQQVAAYNADIMEGGAKFHKTPEEMRVLASRKLRSRDPERVFRNFGVELEVEKICGGPPDLLARTRATLGPFVMVKRDGSLSRHGQGGFEIVSAPATLAFHKGGIWTPFFQHLGPFFHEQPATTGLHVHIGLNTLSPVVVDKIVMFVNAQENREFVFGMANRNLLRKNPNGRLYAGVREWAPGDMMRLKQHQGNCPWHPQNTGQKNYYKTVNGVIQADPFGNPIISSLDSNPSTVRPTCRCMEGHYNIEHYEAVNLRTHRPTVELRIFRGVVNEQFLYACLEFCDSLADFCGETSPYELHFKNYLEFLIDKTKRYRNLYRLLVNQCWIDPPKDKGRTEELSKVPAYGIYA